jgi:type I restriction enzyme S subunit
MNSDWRVYALKDVVALQRGHDLPARTRSRGIVPVIGSGGIAGWHNVAKGCGPGLILGRATNLGIPQWVQGPYWPLNTTLYVTDFKGNDPKFVFHLFETLDLSGYDSGSVQPMLNRNNIAQVPLRIPSLPEQRRIAGVLGALDDLIETNQQLARDLDDLFNASWRLAAAGATETSKIGEHAVVTKGLSYKGAFLASSGIPMVNLGSFGLDGTYKEVGIKFYAESQVKDRHRLNQGDLVVANTDLTQVRDILARPIINPYALATSTHHTYQLRVPEGEAVRYWLYAALRKESTRQRLISYATGTTVAALPLDALTSQDVPWLPERAITRWWEVARPFLDSRLGLIEETAQLRRTRDELLPLLLSGRVSVREVAA